MQKICVLLSVFFMINLSYADNGNSCTNWVKKRASSCVDNAGTKASIWKRQCTDLVCNYDEEPWDEVAYYEYGCKHESICTTENPNNITKCGEWKKQRNTMCISHTGLFEQKWGRSCVIGGPAENFCSDSIHPSSVKDCTKWIKDSNETCNAGNGKWEAKWSRQCVENQNLQMEFCSNSIDPNDLSL